MHGVIGADTMTAQNSSQVSAYLGGLSPRLLAYLRVLLGDLHAAEDVLQELFLVYLRSGPPAGTPDAERWLFRVARNLGLKSVRGARRRQQRETLYGSRGLAVADPAVTVEQQEAMARIQGCLERLDAELRELVYLKMVENLSYREIEEQTGVPRSTVSLRVQEALVLLSKYFHGA